jgi:hypothetical protein
MKQTANSSKALALKTRPDRRSCFDRRQVSEQLAERRHAEVRLGVARQAAVARPEEQHGAHGESRSPRNVGGRIVADKEDPLRPDAQAPERRLEDPRIGFAESDV